MQRSVILAIATLLLLAPHSATAQPGRDWRAYDRWRCAQDGDWCRRYCWWNEYRQFVCRHGDDDNWRWRNWDRDRDRDRDNRDRDRDNGYRRPY